MNTKELEYYKSMNYLFRGLERIKDPRDPAFQAELDVIRQIPIYKYMGLKHVVSMIRNGVLWVGKVSAWDDVYENIIFKQNFFHDLGQGPVPVGVNSVGDNIFGQCWTFRRESDAMWRIYSPSKSDFAVRVKTTVGKLVDAAFTDPQAIPSVFVGEVSYVDNAEISNRLSEYAQNGLHLSSSMKEFARLLCLKRREFEHEEEIRLIIAKDSEYRSDHVELPIDPHVFIDEITLDPRMIPLSPEFNHYRSELLLSGISTGKVNRSKLYDLPAPVDIVIL